MCVMWTDRLWSENQMLTDACSMIWEDWCDTPEAALKLFEEEEAGVISSDNCPPVQCVQKIPTEC